MFNTLPTRFRHYEVQKLLGSGGFGSVYLARDTKLKRLVVLKTLHPHLAAQPDMVRRFLREAQAMARLDHANIVRVNRVEDDPQMPFFEMEYVEGETLAAYRRGRMLPLPEVMPILKQMAAALDAAHRRKMVHRDVKPANVLIKPDGTLKLTDFGIIKFLEATGTVHPSTGGIIGTPVYMAPEQADLSRKHEIGPATDIYALGVMTYQLLTGHLPFSGGHAQAILYAHANTPPPDPRQFNAYLPASVAEVLLQALDKQPRNRYPNAMSFVEALESSISIKNATVFPIAPSIAETNPFVKASSGTNPTIHQTLPSQGQVTWSMLIGLGLIIVMVGFILRPLIFPLTELVVTPQSPSATPMPEKATFLPSAPSAVAELPTATSVLPTATSEPSSVPPTSVSSNVTSVPTTHTPKLPSATAVPATPTPLPPTPAPPSATLVPPTIAPTMMATPSMHVIPATPVSPFFPIDNNTLSEILALTLLSTVGFTTFVGFMIVKKRSSGLPYQPTTFIVANHSLFKDKGHPIEALIQEHLQKINPKLEKKEGTRLFLTGFGSFGGTSLVQATTAKLIRNFRDNQAGNVLVIRFDTSDRTRSGQYKLFINETPVDSISKPVDQKLLVTNIYKVLTQPAKSSNTQSSDPDFFQGMTAAFAQDPTSSEAIARLVSQVLNLLQAKHNNIEIRNALNDLLATPSKNKIGQIVLIIDHVEQAEAMQRLLNSSIYDDYSKLSLIVVARRQAFNRWPQRLREQVLSQRWMEYYYVRRLWLEDFNVQEMLKLFMHVDVSALNRQQRRRFDSLLAHLTYEARGSVARVIRELKKGPYLSEENKELAISLDAALKDRRENIEHNVRVQNILDRHWPQITGKGLLSRVEMADQAKIGVYYVIEWIRHHPMFSRKELVAIAGQQKEDHITISDNEDIREEILDNLLYVLEENDYLQYQPEQNNYRLTWRKNPPSRFKKQLRRMTKRSRRPRRRSISKLTVNHDAEPKRTPPPTPQPPTPTPGGSLRIALLGDKTAKTDEVTTLAIQIGFEVLEKGYRLVMTDRVGVDATVRERLAPYCAVAGVKGPMLVGTSQGGKSKQEGVISVSDSHQQLEEFLKKADVLILAQKDGTSDPVFASGVVKERAKKQGVPVIEPFANLDATKPFFVPDVARQMVAEAKEACVRV